MIRRTWKRFKAYFARIDSSDKFDIFDILD